MSEDYTLGKVEVSSTPQFRFEEFLQSRGKRITQQRRDIVEHVFNHHEHFDADELLAQLQDVYGSRKISRPTVYRTLAELVDAGMLVKLDLGGRAIYEHDYGYPTHDHLHCEKCNKLIEFKSEEIERIRNEVARTHKFHVSGHHLIVNGICDDCKKAASRPTRKLDLV